MGVLQVHVLKRQPTLRDETVPDLVITASRSIRDDEGVPEFVADAARIVDALWDTLPGGTIDRMVIELIQRRASVLKVGLLSAAEVAALSVAIDAHHPNACRGECDDHR